MRDESDGRERRRRSAVAAAGVVGALVAGLAPSGVSAEPATPAAPIVTVSPDTGLLDGQSVAVTGEGFPAGQALQAKVCSGALCEPVYRDTPNLPDADDSGALEGAHVVSRLLYADDGSVVDCAVAACTLRIRGWGSPTVTYADVPLGFDASVPSPAPPTLVVTPDTGLTDGQAVQVTASGFQRGYITVVVAQCRTGATSPVECAPGIGGRDAAFTVDLALSRFLDLPSGRVDCAVEGACVVMSNPGRLGPLRTSAAIRFATPAVPAGHEGAVTPNFAG